MPKITTREQSAILKSLAAGVVPAIGLQHIQVGRLEEVNAIVRDLELVEQGASTIRFVVGRYGSGKTFFLNLARNVAMQRRFVVAQADITTDRRLYASDGKARALYGELMRNIATRAKPEGGALPSLVERWISEIDHDIRSSGGTDQEVKSTLSNRLRPLQEMVSGFDFTSVLTSYYEGFLEDDQGKQDAALRWLRAEYTTKTEARNDLGVRTIIDDRSFYDYLKLMASFVRIAGYSGLVVNIDELVVLSHRLNNSVARNNNYEALLRILNDSLQGVSGGVAFLFAGTNECLEDRRRGLFSYEALATRLASNVFASDGRKDFASPVIRLASLTPEDCFVLLSNIRHVFASGDANSHLVPDEGIIKFLEYCNQRLGAAYFQTPRDTVKAFVSFLQVLEQNPNVRWENVLTLESVPSGGTPEPLATKKAGELTEFRL